jgi:hypothetical protein
VVQVQEVKKARANGREISTPTLDAMVCRFAVPAMLLLAALLPPRSAHAHEYVQVTAANTFTPATAYVNIAGFDPVVDWVFAANHSVVQTDNATSCTPTPGGFNSGYRSTGAYVWFVHSSSLLV